jgi:hypothetical protein
MEWSMKSLLRVGAAVFIGSIVARGAWAASPFEAAINTPDSTQACALPSVMASTPMTRDYAVRLASADEPVALDPASNDVTFASAAANGAATCATDDQNCCHSCDACSQYMCCCPSMWYVSAGAAILHRDRPDPGIIVGNNPFTGVAFSRGSDFNFNWAGGPDITIGRRLGDESMLMVRYFNSYETADVNFRTPGGFIGAGFTGPANTLFNGHALTKLDSTEINLRRQQWDQLALLVGFRWVELKDEAAYKINTTVAEGDYEYNNHLYGGQIGADWAVTSPRNPLQLNVVGKAGVFGNANDGGIFESRPVGNPIGSFAGRGSSTSFVGELDFTAAYIFTDHIAIRGGYQLLWLSDLALATNEASRSLLNPSLLRNVNDDSHLFYQGATVAIDFVW